MKSNNNEKNNKTDKNKKANRKKYSPERESRILQLAASGVVFLIEVVTTLITIGLYYLFIFLNLIPKNTIVSIWVPVIIFASCNLVGAIAASFFSAYYLKPIAETISALHKVAKGDFSIRLDEQQGNSHINELKKSLNETARELGSIEVMRNDFTNIISHEFKTPVASIMGYAQQLKSDNLTDEERALCVDVIIEESKKLSSMTGDILFLSKLENTGIMTDKKDFSLDEQLRNCVQLLQNEWLAKNIEFDGELNEVTYNSNEDLMRHIWLNLLQNAIKYTDDGGKISVSLYETGNKIFVKIRDNGCGMSEEEQKHIFTKFYQADSSRKTGGNGLGLSIVKRLVDMCGGTIEVESARGIGSEFTVIFDK